MTNSGMYAQTKAMIKTGSLAHAGASIAVKTMDLRGGVVVQSDRGKTFDNKPIKNTTQTRIRRVSCYLWHTRDGRQNQLLGKRTLMNG